MWNAVPLVSTGYVLAAFVVAAAVTALGFYLRAYVKTGADSNKYDIRAKVGDRVAVQTAIAADLKRHLRTILLVGFIASLLTAIVLYAIGTAAHAGTSQPKPRTLQEQLQDSDTLRRAQSLRDDLNDALHPIAGPEIVAVGAAVAGFKKGMLITRVRSVVAQLRPGIHVDDLSEDQLLHELDNAILLAKSDPGFMADLRKTLVWPPSAATKS